MNPRIRGLHHNAYRCSDSERTRRFYEDLLGLPLVAAFEIGETKTGRKTMALHSFFRMKKPALGPAGPYSPSATPCSRSSCSIRRA